MCFGRCKCYAITMLLVTIFILPSLGRASSGILKNYFSWGNIWNDIKTDYSSFYSPNRLASLTLAYGVGSEIANSDIDEDTQWRYQNFIRSSGTDDLAGVAKTFGEHSYLLPAALAAAGIGKALPEHYLTSSLGNWGELTFRAYLVGGPAVQLMQRVSGASRPKDFEADSHWNPFNDENGVSGHAFAGAVPFLTLAHMTDSPYLRYVFFGISTLAAWSRINDNAHYSSQALLGWFMAWEAVSAVSDSDNNSSNFSFKPQLFREGCGIVLNWQW